MYDVRDNKYKNSEVKETNIAEVRCSDNKKKAKLMPRLLKNELFYSYSAAGVSSIGGISGISLPFSGTSISSGRS